MLLTPFASGDRGGAVKVIRGEGERLLIDIEERVEAVESARRRREMEGVCDWDGESWSGMRLELWTVIIPEGIVKQYLR